MDRRYWTHGWLIDVKKMIFYASSITNCHRKNRFLCKEKRFKNLKCLSNQCCEKDSGAVTHWLNLSRWWIAMAFPLLLYRLCNSLRLKNLNFIEKNIFFTLLLTSFILYYIGCFRLTHIGSIIILINFLIRLFIQFSKFMFS